MTAMTSVRRRLATLEALSDDGGDGCPRCRGTLLTIHDAVSGDLHRASWNGGEISPQELGQRRTETRCPPSVWARLNRRSESGYHDRRPSASGCLACTVLDGA